MMVEVKHKTIVELQTLYAGDCFIYNDTVYMMLQNDKDRIRENKDFPYTATELATGKLNQFTAWAKVVKANARAIIE